MHTSSQLSSRDYALAVLALLRALDASVPAAVSWGAAPMPVGDTVGRESVVTGSPQAIVVVDYDKRPVREEIDYLQNRSRRRTRPL